MSRFAVICAAFLIGANTGLAADSVDPPTASELERIFRALALPLVPKPLLEEKSTWGHQEMVSVGMKWEKKGILLKPEMIKSLRNDGVWRKFTLSTNDLEKTLDLRVKDVKLPEPGRINFSATIQLPVNLKLEQQRWTSGVRLYTCETRARCKAILQLNCESTSRFDKKPEALLPDMLMRLRVVDAKLSYKDFVLEHAVGVGGDLAKILGEATHESIKLLKPTLERNLLAKANAAIVKAGDTKEVRLGLGQLLEIKK